MTKQISERATLELVVNSWIDDDDKYMNFVVSLFPKDGHVIPQNAIIRKNILFLSERDSFHQKRDTKLRKPTSVNDY